MPAAAAYQLTVTELGTACGPGSDGNPCDDENPCTSSDTCDTGACVGTPVANDTPCRRRQLVQRSRHLPIRNVAAA